jgi:undecaprenyl diphosphate synthase
LNFSSSPAARNELDPDRLPKHVAIIMDGNGRWAKQRLLNRLKGHERGTETVRAVVRCARQLNIAALTLYAFSTENWRRPQAEISGLMTLLRRFLASERESLMENEIRLSTIGQTDRLPAGVRETLQAVMAETAVNRKMVLNLALSYGSRAEILEMVQRIATKAQRGALNPSEVTPATIAAHLYTRDLPDPDLLIRTSGERRISNFLLWQIAYAELYFTPTLWPDFGEAEFVDILKDYQGRERRYGAVATNG